MSTGRVRYDVRVEGVVQGVGFRPFVYALASRLGLAGRVGNDGNGVFIEVEGPAADVQRFLRGLERQAPPLATLDRVAVTAAEPTGTTGFTIAPSRAGGRRRTLVTADSATCADCLRELADPADRRFGFPFINCTNCGPRFTIVRDVPYDRPLTTMAGFAMCPACAAEYHDPADRRFHAQPICCPDCGPRLRLADRSGQPLGGQTLGGQTLGGQTLGGQTLGGQTLGGQTLGGQTLGGQTLGGQTLGGQTLSGQPLPGDPVGEAARLLHAGRVLAVKGLGGYHLAVLADDEAAAATLRQRKHREDKPFAVMVSDVDQAGTLCDVDRTARELLTSRRRPIVLLPRIAGAPVAGSVAPGNRQLGLMLPYTPLHHLLLGAAGRPVVLTSGNVSDEPIAYLDADAFARLAGIADAFLTHDRPIHIRADDSVVRPFRGHGSVLRRSRGYAPDPVPLHRPLPRPVLACGAELKNTFCLARDRHAFVSQHIGDLENYQTLRSFVEGIEHYRRLFGIDPAVVAHDLHPEYLSTKYAEELTGVELVGVQHHHAHIASCLADNGESGPVIGVAFDGLGYGTDGTLWGGEFLVAGLADYQRVGHLVPVPMPGGAAAIRQPWRMAVAYLDAAFGGQPPERLAVVGRNASRWPAVRSIARAGVNSPLTSSAGRLFDAVSAILGLRDAVNYEGQAAIELEQCADPAEQGSYPATVSGGSPMLVTGADLVRAAAEDLLRGAHPAAIAARFHNGMADAITRGCATLRSSTGLATVALSGGVFQNLLLLSRTVDRLRATGFGVLTHSRVPTNDGGISLGQAVVAGALDRAAGRSAGWPARVVETPVGRSPD